MVLHQGLPEEVSSSIQLLQTIVVTSLVIALFLGLKLAHYKVRDKWNKVTIVTIGAGPIGLLSTIIALNTGRVRRVIIYEKHERNELFQRPYQIGLDVDSVCHLRQVGVDFDNIEGCWKNGNFFTHVGVFIEYLIDRLQLIDVPMVIHYGKQFHKQHLSKLDTITGRLVLIISDGSHGKSASIFGMSDIVKHHTCHAYGSVARIHRFKCSSIPSPDIRVHNLSFHLDEFHRDVIGGPTAGLVASGFHLKLFASQRHMYMTLVVPCWKVKMSRALKLIADRTQVMRNIFQVCFNKFKPSEESIISDLAAVRGLSFQSRLTEVKVTQKQESTCYFQEEDMFVLLEGEILRKLNIKTGMDINLSIRGLQFLDQFLHLATVAMTNNDVMNALRFKHSCDKYVCKEFVANGLPEHMFSG